MIDNMGISTIYLTVITKFAIIEPTTDLLLMNVLGAYPNYTCYNTQYLLLAIL